MKAGRLDRRIRIERKAVTYSPSGAPLEAWSTLATRWAEARPLDGTERFSEPQLLAQGFTTFRIRWSSSVSDVDPLDRAIFDGRVYDIMAVREIGRREGLEIDAVYRADIEPEDDEVFTPSLDFREARNSQYVGQVI